MECHKCAHAAAVSSGAFSGVPWEETPCSRCSALPDGAPLKERTVLDEGRARGVSEVDGYPSVELPVKVLGDALRLLLGLPSEDLEVLRLRWRGCRWGAVAAAVGATVAACQVRMTRLVRREPLLLELVPSLKAKVGRRRSRPAGDGRGGARSAARPRQPDGARDGGERPGLP